MSDSFSDFVEVWEPQIRKYCARAGFVEPDLDDLVQDILEHMLSHNLLGRFDAEKGSFDRWVWNNVILVMSHWRQRRRRRSRFETTNAVQLTAHPLPDPLIALDGGSDEAVSDGGFAIVECNEALTATARDLAADPKALVVFKAIVASVAEGDTACGSYRLAARTGLKLHVVRRKLDQVRAVAAPLQEVLA